MKAFIAMVTMAASAAALATDQMLLAEQMEVQISASGDAKLTTDLAKKKKEDAAAAKKKKEDAAAAKKTGYYYKPYVPDFAAMKARSARIVKANKERAARIAAAVDKQKKEEAEKAAKKKKEEADKAKREEAEKAAAAKKKKEEGPTTITKTNSPATATGPPVKAKEEKAEEKEYPPIKLEPVKDWRTSPSLQLLAQFGVHKNMGAQELYAHLKEIANRWETCNKEHQETKETCKKKKTELKDAQYLEETGDIGIRIVWGQPQHPNGSIWYYCMGGHVLL